jgi:hypothetical protein
MCSQQLDPHFESYMGNLARLRIHFLLLVQAVLTALSAVPRCGRDQCSTTNLRTSCVRMPHLEQHMYTAYPPCPKHMYTRVLQCCNVLCTFEQEVAIR